MFPYSVELRTQRTPVVTLAMIAICVGVWIAVQGAGFGLAVAASVCNYGLIPGQLTGAVRAGTRFPMAPRLLCVVDPGRGASHVITSMFLHGSWMHLLGNMWFLWLFGKSIEDVMTRARFAAFYLLCGLVAGLVQVAADWRSVVPMVGASGAISGVMGAYLMLFPRVRVHTFIPLGFFLHSMALPAWAMLLYWAFLQLVGGLSQVGGTQGGVAFLAHVGGFIAGVVLARLFVPRDQFLAPGFTSRRAPW